MTPAPQPCGTKAGYQRHLRRREPACDPCTAANTAHRREHFGGSRERNRLYQQAVRNANKRLQEMHPAAWRQVLAEERDKFGGSDP